MIDKITGITVMNHHETNEEWIVVDFLNDPWTQYYLVTVDDYKIWLDSYVDMSEYQEKEDVDYGEGEYGWEYMTNWDLYFDYFFTLDYVRMYVKAKNIKKENLSIKP